jgi:hypothetical protein
VSIGSNRNSERYLRCDQGRNRFRQLKQLHLVHVFPNLVRDEEEVLGLAVQPSLALGEALDHGLADCLYVGLQVCFAISLAQSSQAACLVGTSTDSRATMAELAERHARQVDRPCREPGTNGGS